MSFLTREPFRAIASTDNCGAIRRRAPIEFLQLFKNDAQAERIVQSDLIEPNEIFLAEIPNATLVGERAFITDKRQLLVTDSFHSRHTAAIFEVNERRQFEGVQLTPVPGGYVYSDPAQETIDIAGRVVALTAMEAGNYGAFLLRLIPKIMILKQLGLLKSQILAPLATAWQKNLLRVFGVDVETVIPHDRTKRYLVERLLVPSMRTSEFFLDDGCQNYYRSVAQKIVRERFGQPKYEYLYVSRMAQARIRPHYRHFMNEEELVNALVPYGFHIFEPEKHSIEEQIFAFATARVVVGPGGAGMFNTVFCSPGAKVLSLEPMLDWLGLHLNLFSSTGNDYAIVYGGVDETDFTAQKRWRTEVGSVVNLFNRVR